MTRCSSRIELGNLHGKQITGGFEGGDICTDGGLMLVEKADRRLKLTKRLSAVLTDTRDPGKVKHSLAEMIRQRVYQIACGYQDCNDADDLGFAPLLKAAVGRLPQNGPQLASQPTLSRRENSVTRSELYRMSQMLVDLFIQRHSGPRKVVVDIDATDDPTHGQQQLSGFHGYYDEHCYLPLIVTARVEGEPDELLAAILRPGRSYPGARAVTMLKRLVAKLREAWPDVTILVRADSGFARPEVYRFCETHGIPYLIGLITNPRLQQLAELYLKQARAYHDEPGRKVRRLHETHYAAASWRHKRRVLVKAEVTDRGDNPRFVATDMSGDPLVLYDCYAGRGEAENRIKELKDLAIDRTSCHRFLPNQFRLILHAAAFVLLSFLRRHLADTELASAQVATIQRKLLKLGGLVKETCRRVWLHFASSCPLQRLWPTLPHRLRAAPG